MFPYKIPAEYIPRNLEKKLMNPASVSNQRPKMSKRQDTIVASRAEFTALSLSKPEWEINFTPNGKDKKISKKMKFPRRNSLTFPMRPSNLAPIRKEQSPECNVEDPFTNLVRQRSVEKLAFPLISKLDKALTILNDDNHSVSTVSNTSNSTESTEDDQVLHVHEFSKGASAISTPVPHKKKALQFPAAKRKQMSLLGGEESPSSVSDSFNRTSLSLSDDKKKSKPKRSIAASILSKPSSLKSPSVDDSSEKSSSRRTNDKNRNPRRKIHFKQTCTMRRTLSRKDMTPKEIQRAWLTSGEYERMQLRDEILADRVDAGKSKIGDCVRGLESKIEETAMKKLHLRMTGIEEILLEQERQWDEAGDAAIFYYDFPSFLYVYAQVSEQALKAAQEMGSRDRLAALTAIKSMDRAKGAAGFLKKRSRFTRRRSWA